MRKSLWLCLSVFGVILVLGVPNPTRAQTPLTGFQYLPLILQANKVGDPSIGGCPVFPADHIWNTRVDSLPVDPHSADYIQSMNPATSLHADFGSGTWNGAPIGIPYVVVPGTQPYVSIQFTYAGESDPGPYPIPPTAPIEGGAQSSGDRHVIIINNANCRLYELFAAYPQPDNSWKAGSGAVFDLLGYQLRPDTWTSADAAGLPIFPGLARYDEFALGEIRHALRITAAVTQKRHVWPARHDASNNMSFLVPPMGQRFRLKSSFDLTSYTQQERVVLIALQRYGVILADNGSNWYVSGAPDERWDNDFLHHLFGSLHGSDFEAVDSTSLMVDPNSGLAKP